MVLIFKSLTLILPYLKCFFNQILSFYASKRVILNDFCAYFQIRHSYCLVSYKINPPILSNTVTNLKKFSLIK